MKAGWGSDPGSPLVGASILCRPMRRRRRCNSPTMNAPTTPLGRFREGWRLKARQAKDLDHRNGADRDGDGGHLPRRDQIRRGVPRGRRTQGPRWQAPRPRPAKGLTEGESGPHAVVGAITATLPSSTPQPWTLAQRRGAGRHELHVLLGSLHVHLSFSRRDASPGASPCQDIQRSRAIGGSLPGSAERHQAKRGRLS
jgi:hypothetical protein